MTNLDKKTNKSFDEKQAVLDAFLQEGPLADWLKIFKMQLSSRVYESNAEKILLLGCQLLNQAAHLFIGDAYRTPANMFTAIVSRSGAGKSTVMRIMREICYQTPHINVISRGSPEGIEEDIEDLRRGIIFWDEAGELIEKGADYMQRVRNVLNQAYYLDAIERRKTTKRSVCVKARSYYVSAVFAALPEEWSTLVEKWRGGFERRVLPLRLKKMRRMYDREGLKPEIADIIHSLIEWLAPLKDKAFVIDWEAIKPFLEEAARKYDIPEEHEVAIEEYTMFVFSSIILSKVLARIGKENLSAGNVTLSHVPNDIRSLVCDIDDICDIYIVTHCDIVTLFADENGDRSFVTKALVTLSDIVTRWVLNCFAGSAATQVSDEVVARILERIAALRERGVAYMSYREFVRKILRTGNAKIYRGYLEFLEDAGEIKILSMPRTRGKVVIVDPNAKICGNCALFKRACHDVDPTIPACDKFEKIKEYEKRSEEE